MEKCEMITFGATESHQVDVYMLSAASSDLGSVQKSHTPHLLPHFCLPLCTASMDGTLECVFFLYKTILHSSLRIRVCFGYKNQGLNGGTKPSGAEEELGKRWEKTGTLREQQV
jgi:hypothetical protein